MMTHGNIVATTAAVMTVIPRLGSSDVYLAYLPLAHVFELAAESIMLTAGAAIGYGSALTLTDGSNKIKKGTMGDASELKPTLMAAVPAILDRVRDGVVKKVEEKGGIAKKLFHIAYKRRLAAVEGSWFGAWGVEKQFWDAIVFKKIRTILGGEIRFMLCGGAPLSADTQRFINVCMGAPIGQGYGLTETCVGAAFSEWDDPSVGRVGPPLPCAYIKKVHVSDTQDDGSFWNRGINAFKKLPEWSEIVAGPRWKTFIRRFNRTKSGGKRSAEFQYDPLSYSLNFDHGPGNNGNSDEDDDFRFRNFSSRYATTPPLQNKGSIELDKDGHNFV